MISSHIIYNIAENSEMCVKENMDGHTTRVIFDVQIL